MKKLFLLAAMAAPLALTAQTAADTDLSKPQVGYDFPAGTFFTTAKVAANGTSTNTTTKIETDLYVFADNGTESKVAILPWGNNQIMKNISVLQGSSYDGNWWWNTQVYTGVFDKTLTVPFYTANTLVADTENFTYTGSYTTIPYAFQPFAAPIVFDAVYNDDETLNDTESPQYQWGDGNAYVSIAGVSSTQIPTCTVYNPDPAFATITPGVSSPAFKTFDSKADEMWMNIYSYEYDNIALEGVAQYVAYPGRPYIVSGVTINTAASLAAGDNFTVSIYEAAPDVNTLPDEPIASTEFTVTEAESGATEYKVDMTEIIPISTPVYIVVNNIGSTSFQPLIVTAAAKNAAVPAPANQGLKGVVRTSYSDDATANTLLDYTDYTADNTLPVALDMTVDVKYVYVYPYQEGRTYDTTLGKRPTWQYGQQAEVVLSQDKNWTILDCKSSSPAKSLVITLEDGSDIPDWLTIVAADVVNQPNIVTLDFSTASSNIDEDVTVMVTAPGNISTLIAVKADTTNGIGAVSSDAEVVSREYYDLSGRRLTDAPVKGFFIEKVIRADGTTTATSRMN